jgi:hypothetical protein
MAGSVVKILGVLTVFKLGSKVFNKLKDPLASFFAEIIRKAGETGEAAGDAAKAGLERSRQKSASK